MTGVVLGRVTFGAANLGNLYRSVTDDEAWATLEAAWDAGIRSFDTAPHYGLGLSERRLGAFLQTKPRADFVISTKVGRLLRPNGTFAGELDAANSFAVPAALQRVWDVSPDGVRRSIDESLGRLGLDAVDIAYLHDPEKVGNSAATADGIAAVIDLRDQGMVLAAGVGSMSTAALRQASTTDGIDLLMVAGRYTLLEQPAAAEIIPECRRRGVGIVVASVFNSGLLAAARPEKTLRYDYEAVPEPLLRKALALAEICDTEGTDLPTAALHFPLREPAVRSVVIATARPEQVRQNCARLQKVLPDSLWGRLDAVLANDAREYVHAARN